MLQCTENTKIDNNYLYSIGKLHCRTCKTIKSLDAMVKEKNSKYGGYSTRCKQCNNNKRTQYYINNREKDLLEQKQRRDDRTEEEKESIRRRNKEYQIKNKEHIKERRRVYYINNSELIKQKVIIWSKTNVEKMRVYRRNWEVNNPEKVLRSRIKYTTNNIAKLRLSRSIYKKNNPLRTRIHTNLRRARLVNARGTVTYQQILELFDKQQWLCVYCHADLGVSYNIDHIVPLSIEWDGEHNDISNFQLLCPTCNQRKNNKTHEQFLVYCEKVAMYDSSYILKYNPNTNYA